MVDYLPHGGDPFRLTWYPAGSAPRRRARARRSCQRTRSRDHADHHAHHGLVGIDPPADPASPPVMRAKTWRRNAGRCIIGQRAYQRGKLHSFRAETSQGKCKSAFLQNTPSVVKTTRVSNTTMDARTNRFLFPPEQGCVGKTGLPHYLRSEIFSSKKSGNTYATYATCSHTK